MSGLNGQFNARLQRLEKKAAEGGGSSGGLVEIKNVEPFQVPDLVNGGTRLFDPANDSIYIIESEEEPYHKISEEFIVSKSTPPGILSKEIPRGLMSVIITSWLAEQVYEIPNAINVPQFCVTPSTVYRLQANGGDYYLINQEYIVYKYTSAK